LRAVPKTDNNELSFEEGIQRLEAIVDAMEAGDLPLETLMQKFEDGTKLAKLCQDKLAQAEVRIQQIEQTSAGELTVKPFEAHNANE
jgi:exodeoxyribonuclease VII small subunit